MIRIDRHSLIAAIGGDERLDRIEAACAAQGTTLGPVSDADPLGTLHDALLARAGRRSPRYGELWDRVLSLEADLPGGRRLVTKGAPRAATGPDVTRTVLEARGKLGAVKAVHVRLKTAPRERTLLYATAIDLAHALDAARAVLHTGALAAEVTLQKDAGQSAHLRMLFEGDPLLVAADVTLARRALAGRDGVFTEENAPHAGGDGQGAATPASKRVVALTWAAAKGTLSPGENGRLVAIAHEGPTLELDGPTDAARAPATSPLAAAYLSRIADALARRCS